MFDLGPQVLILTIIYEKYTKIAFVASLGGPEEQYSVLQFRIYAIEDYNVNQCLV